MLSFGKLIAVSLIILIILAIAVVGVFRSGISHIETFSGANAFCGASGVASCSASGGLPLTWNMNTLDVNGTRMTCAQLKACGTCKSCGFV